MNTKLKTACLLLIIFIVSTIEKDYDISFDRMGLEFYNTSLAGNNSEFRFRKLNRTTFVVNITFDLLVDLDGRDIQGTATVYQLFSNVYRYTGMNYTVNVCDIWTRDFFHATTRMKKFGNLEACDIKKGHYYLYNYTPDGTYGPDSFIFGNFKVVVTIWFKSTNEVILIYHWLGGVKKKLREG